MQLIQARNVYVALIHHIEHARLQKQDFQNIDFVQLAIADLNKRKKLAFEVQ